MCQAGPGRGIFRLGLIFENTTTYQIQARHEPWAQACPFSQCVRLWSAFYPLLRLSSTWRRQISHYTTCPNLFLGFLPINSSAAQILNRPKVLDPHSSQVPIPKAPWFMTTQCSPKCGIYIWAENVSTISVEKVSASSVEKHIFISNFYRTKARKEKGRGKSFPLHGQRTDGQRMRFGIR